MRRRCVVEKNVSKIHLILLSPWIKPPGRQVVAQSLPSYAVPTSGPSHVLHLRGATSRLLQKRRTRCGTPDGKLVPGDQIGNRRDDWPEQVTSKYSVGGASSSSGAYGGQWETSVQSWDDRAPTHASSGSGKWHKWSITHREHTATDQGVDWSSTKWEPAAAGKGGVCNWADFTLNGDDDYVASGDDDIH